MSNITLHRIIVPQLGREGHGRGIGRGLGVRFGGLDRRFELLVEVHGVRHGLTDRLAIGGVRGGLSLLSVGRDDESYAARKEISSARARTKKRGRDSRIGSCQSISSSMSSSKCDFRTSPSSPCINLAFS